MKRTAAGMIVVWLAVAAVTHYISVLHDRIREMTVERTALLLEKAHWEEEATQHAKDGYWYVPGGRCYSTDYTAKILAGFMQ